MTIEQTPRELRMREFRTVRGESTDEDWAATAWATLVLRGGTSHEAADEALLQVLELVRESGEGPQELYGPPEEWARERVAEWATEGSPAFRDDPTRLRDLPAGAAAMAVVLTLLLGLASAMQREWSVNWTFARLFLPFLGSLLGLGVMAMWNWASARRSMTASAAISGGVLLLGSAALVTVFAATSTHPVARASLAWCLPQALAYGVLAWLLNTLVPDPPAVDAAPDDEAWSQNLARMLRSRPDLTEERVQQVLGEARSHAAATGHTLQEEFGDPAAYVAQVSPRPMVKARRSALYQVGMLALYVWLGWDTLTGGSTGARVFYGVALACLGVCAVLATVRFARLSWQSRRHGRAS